jgi:hypothetical protein
MVFSSISGMVMKEDKDRHVGKSAPKRWQLNSVAILQAGKRPFDLHACPFAIHKK